MFIKQLLGVAIMLMTMTANATIVIRGEIREVEHGAGMTSFRCKGQRGTCVVINPGTRVAELMEKERVIGRYSFTDYKTDKTTIDGVESTAVTMLGTKKL